MNKNSITHLFEDVNLYEQKEFNFYSKIDDTYSKVENRDFLKLFDFLGLVGDSKLITDCIWCEGHFPFSYSTRVMEHDSEIYSLDIGKIDSGHSIFINFSDPKYVNCKIVTNTIRTQLFTIEYYFKCTNNTDYHNYYMSVAVLIDKEKVVVIKIGQFPENSSLGHFSAEDYKKELRKINDSYVDYKNSEKSFRHGLYAGAYDYLRRVFEKIINYYLEKNNIKLEKSWGAKEKIATVRSCFDKRIQNFLYPLYSALSIGVHSMPEEECKENYNELKAIIDIQLQFIKSEEELDSQIKNSRNILETLNNKYSKK